MHQAWVELENVQIPPGSIWVALDSVADPGNLGTILRTLDAVGGQGVILLDQSTDPYDPSAARASMGALFTQRLVKTSFAQFCEWRRKTGAPIIGTSDAAAQDYHSYTYPPGLVLLMGASGTVCKNITWPFAMRWSAYPWWDRSDSLNLAVATAVVLYEIRNQRREKP